jgi:glucan phosphorylase
VQAKRYHSSKRHRLALRDLAILNKELRTGSIGLDLYTTLKQVPSKAAPDKAHMVKVYLHSNMQDFPSKGTNYSEAKHHATRQQMLWYL